MNVSDSFATDSILLLHMKSMEKIKPEVCSQVNTAAQMRWPAATAICCLCVLAANSWMFSSLLRIQNMRGSVQKCNRHMDNLAGTWMDLKDRSSENGDKRRIWFLIGMYLIRIYFYWEVS